MCTSINIDGETIDMHRGEENLSMLSLLVLSACITFRNFHRVSLKVEKKEIFNKKY